MGRFPFPSRENSDFYKNEFLLSLHTKHNKHADDTVDDVFTKSFQEPIGSATFQTPALKLDNSNGLLESRNVPERLRKLAFLNKDVFQVGDRIQVSGESTGGVYRFRGVQRAD